MIWRQFGKVQFLLVCLLPLLRTLTDARTFLTSAHLRTVDGNAHLAAVVSYKAGIFPDVFGWLPTQFSGMPFPLYYPPAMFWLSSALASTNSGASWVLRLIVVVAFYCLTPMLFVVVRAHYDSTPGADMFAATTACVVLFYPPLAGGLLGLTAYGTFALGLYSQTIAMLLFLLWLRYIARGRDWRVEGLLLASALLTNVFVSVFFCIFLIVRAGALCSDLSNSGRASRGHLGDVAKTFAVAAGLTVFWWEPALATYQTFTTRPLSSLGGVLSPYEATFWSCSFLVLFAIIVLRPSLRMEILSATAISSAAALFSVFLHFSDLPSQPGRLIAVATLVLAIPIGVALAICCSYASRLLLRCTRVSIVIPLCGTGVFILTCALMPPHPAGPLALEPRHQAIVREVASFAETHSDGRYIVEFPSAPSQRAVRSAIIGQLLVKGIAVASGVYREATPSSLFDDSMTTAYSSGVSLFGVSTALGSDLDFMDEHGAVRLEQLRSLGVRYVACVTPWVCEKLKRDGLEIIYNGTWKIARVPSAAFIEGTNAVSPVLIISRFTAKERYTNDVSMLRVFEEAFFAMNHTDVLIGNPSAPCDPLQHDLSWVAVLVVANANCTGVNPEQLKQFAHRRPLVVLNDRSFLSSEIIRDRAAFEHLTIVSASSYPGVLMNETEPSFHLESSDARLLWRSIQRISQAEASASGQTSTYKKDGTQQLNTVGSENRVTIQPLSYHARWNCGAECQVLCASPFNLVQVSAHEDGVVTFERGRSDKIALVISAGTLSALVGLLILTVSSDLLPKSSAK